MDHKESNKNCKSLNLCPSLKKVELKDDANLKKYIMWENDRNNCWLDASMALVAHNRVMKKYCQVSPRCNISKIISEYDEAISVLNDPEKNFDHRLNIAKLKLKFIQDRTLTYFEPILKYKIGDPESAFCCLYNLLIQDSDIRDIFDATWLSVKECTNCGDCTVSKKKKPIITLSEIDSFDPENPLVLYNCPCNKSVQKISIVYTGLPPCLIFHFESGAGKENPPLSFTTRGREYQLTGIMTLEKSQDPNVNHFISWVRDPSVNKWLDCNDLNIDIISFSSDFPDIKFRDVFIYVYESFDDMDTIIDSEVEHKKNSKSNEAIPFIDLSESDSENSNSHKDTEKKAISASNSHLQDNVSFVEPGRAKSENNNSQNVSESNKYTRKMEIPAFNSLLQDTSVESDKDKSDNNCSQSYAPGSNIGTMKVEISASESLQGNTSSVEPGRDQFEDSSSLDNMNEDIRKMEIRASDSQLQDYVTSIISDRDKSLETGMSADNMQTFTADRQITRSDFLESLKTAATTSGTSYVKLSVRKKKSGVPLHKKYSVNGVNNPDLGESSSKTIYSPSCSKAVKETRELQRGLDEDYVPSGVPKKMQISRRISNAEKGVINTKGGAHDSKAKVKVLKTGLKKSSQVKSKLKNVTSNKIPGVEKSSQINPKLEDIISKERLHDESYNSSLNHEEEKEPEEHQLFPEQCRVNLGTAYETENSSVPSGVPKEKQKVRRISNAEKGAINTKGAHGSKAKVKVLKTGLKKSSQVKSKLKNFTSKKIPGVKKSSQINPKLKGISKKRIHDESYNSSLNHEEEKEPGEHQLFPEQCHLNLGTASETENSDDKGIKILKDFENDFTCHDPGCNCESAILKQEIDVVVDSTLAYLFQLSKMAKEPSSQ